MQPIENPAVIPEQIIYDEFHLGELTKGDKILLLMTGLVMTQTRFILIGLVLALVIFIAWAIREPLVMAGGIILGILLGLFMGIWLYIQSKRRDI